MFTNGDNMYNAVSGLIVKQPIDCMHASYIILFFYITVCYYYYYYVNSVLGLVRYGCQGNTASR